MAGARFYLLAALSSMLFLASCSPSPGRTPPTAATKPVPVATATTPPATPLNTPSPPSAPEAIAKVRDSTEMSKSAAPFKQEVDWKAEWVQDRWWVAGLFESPWGVRFVADATIWDGRVYAYVNYSMRPKREWVEARAKEWQLEHLYARLTPQDALERVKQTDSVRRALQEVKIQDSVADLLEDTALGVSWRFAFYITRKDARQAVLVVEGLGEKGVKEGSYGSGEDYERSYGFGNAAKALWDVPLHQLDWVRQLAKERGWVKASNLP